MHGDGLAATGGLDPVGISLRQNLLMTVARWNRVIVVLVTHQRQRGDAGGDFVASVIGRRRQRHERRHVRLHPLGDRGGMARAMAQWHEHLTGPPPCLRHVLTHNRIPARKSPFFIPQPLENPMRGVPLLLGDASAGFQDLVDPRHVRPKLLRSWPFTPPVTGRNRKLKHLCDRVPVIGQTASLPHGGSAHPPSPVV
jgi:hypothetical protein